MSDEKSLRDDPKFQAGIEELYKYFQEEAMKEFAEKLAEEKICKGCRKTRSHDDFHYLGKDRWDSDCKLCRHVERCGVDKLSGYEREAYGSTKECGLCGSSFPLKYQSKRESVKWGILCVGCQDLVDRNRYKHLT